MLKKNWVSGLGALLVAWVAAASPLHADDAISFQGKTVSLIVGYAPGGGTDVVGRLIGQYLAKYLPGTPSLVVVNMPGAEGVTAVNYLVKQAKADGIALTIGVSTQVDPLFYPTAHAVYDPPKLRYVGGTGRPGSALLIATKGLERLNDKSVPPVTMGALAALRASMQMALWGTEYLNWNVKWVFGYPGTNDLKLALERGEIDMTALSAIADISEVMKSGNFTVLLQSGALQSGVLRPRSELAKAPLFSDMVGLKVYEPSEKQAIAYTLGLTQVGQWLALPPDAPEPVVAAYRNAFNSTFRDPSFREKLQQIDAELTEMNADEVTALIAKITATSPDVLNYMRSVARKQGIKAE